MTAIVSHSTLITAVKDELNRSDPTDAQVNRWIGLAEARMNRVLRVRGQTQRDTAIISAEFAAVPPDFQGARSMRLADSPYTLLQFVNPEQMAVLKSTLTSGTISHYALVDGEFEFYPIPTADTDVVLTYLQKVPALTAVATTNWMLADHPDCYFRGVMTEAWVWLQDFDKANVNKALFDAAMGEIKSADLLDAYAANISVSPSAYPV